MKLHCLIALLCCATTCEPAKILGVFYYSSKSHHSLGEILMTTLAKRGHNVVLASPYSMKSAVPNCTGIVLHEIYEDMNERSQNRWFKKFCQNSVSLTTLSMLLEVTHTQSELLFHNTEMKKLIESKEKFDLIILDWMFNESHLILSEIFDCPVVLLAAAGTVVNVNYVINNFTPYSYVPFKYFPLTDQMNFPERLLNTIVSFGMYVLLHAHNINHKYILDKHYPNSPSITSLFDRVALVLSNGHYSFETPRPSLPNSIDIGGFHVQDPKPLPKKLQEYLDRATEGFIYFSLGTNVKSTFFKEETRRGILNAFSKVHLKVLWKFEGDLTNIPENVMISKWLPQNDVLAHPNIKLFISHGGLLSTIEAMHHGVPMIGIPMFGDQNSIVPKGVEAGYALQIKASDISEATLLAGINEMISNTSYAEKAKYYSELLRGQIDKPLDRAVYWVEHVIKHKGGRHLRNKGVDLTWYQNMLLDVIAFVLAICIICYYITKISLKTLAALLKRIFRKKLKRN